MDISTKHQMIATTHGALAVEESGHGGIPVLLIHGNSFCRAAIDRIDQLFRFSWSIPNIARCRQCLRAFVASTAETDRI